MDRLRKIASFKWSPEIILICVCVIISLIYYHIRCRINANFCPVIDGKIYRSGQPELSQLESWIKKYGIKTLVNLRGTKKQIIKDEQALTDKLGVKMVSFRLSSSTRLIALLYSPAK